MIILYADASDKSIECALLLRNQRHVILWKNDPGVFGEYKKACHDLAPNEEHIWPAVLTHETDMLFGEVAVEYCQR